MTYMPPPYAAPAATADPTQVIGRRIGAFLVDVIGPLVIAGVVGFLMFLSSATSAPRDGLTCNDVRAQNELVGRSVGCLQTNDRIYVASSSDTNRAVGVGVVVSLLVPLDLFVLQGITGASVGKYMFGLRVVRQNGAIVGFGWNALRTFLLFVALGVSAFCGVGLIAELIVACVTHPHRRVGDMAAGTYVVGKHAVGTPISTPAPTYVPYAPAPAPAPTSGFPPGTYGTSLPPSAPAAGAPSWGTPAQPYHAPAPSPAADASATPTPGEDEAGWAAPAPTAAPVPQAQPQPQPQQQLQQQPSAAPQPQWDPARNAWICWDPARNQWLQWDAAASQWRGIS